MSLARYDVVLTVGTNAFRAYLFDEPVALVEPATRVAVLTADAAEAHRSPCDLAVVAPVGATCRALVELLPARTGNPPEPVRRPAPLAPPAAGEPLRPGHVLDALAERLPDDVLLVEECPSSQPELYQRIPVRVPFGFLSTANGCLGFGLAGSIGLRMGLPDRPVVAVLGDGSTMYAIQALWSAARYDVGVLLVVLANGRYAVMDGLARRAGAAAAAWPGFESVDIGGMARGARAARRCASRRTPSWLRRSTRSCRTWPRGASRCCWRRWWGSSRGHDRRAQDHAGGHHRRRGGQLRAVRGPAPARADAGASSPSARVREPRWG